MTLLAVKIRLLLLCTVTILSFANPPEFELDALDDERIKHRRHPNNVAASIFFPPFNITEGQKTPFPVTLRGLVTGVQYDLGLQVMRDGSIMLAEDYTVHASGASEHAHEPGADATLPFATSMKLELPVFLPRAEYSITLNLVDASGTSDVLASTTRVLSVGCGPDAGEDVSVEIVEPTDGATLFQPHGVRVRVRGLTTSLASCGRELVLHVNGREVAAGVRVGVSESDSQGSDFDDVTIHEHLPLNQPGVYRISATLYVSAGSHGGGGRSARSEAGLKTASVHVFAMDSARFKLSGATIDDKSMFMHIVHLFNNKCPYGRAALPPHHPGFGRQGEEYLWKPVRHCLGEFVRRFPQNLLARWTLGRVHEGDGAWEDALKHYHFVSQHIAVGGALHARIAQVHALAEEEKEHRVSSARCTWCRREEDESPLTDRDGDVSLYLRCRNPRP
jgi:hypothetical protein